MGGGGGSCSLLKFGRLCVPLKKSWLRPWIPHIKYNLNSLRTSPRSVLVTGVLLKALRVVCVYFRDCEMQLILCVKKRNVTARCGSCVN